MQISHTIANFAESQCVFNYEIQKLGKIPTMTVMIYELSTHRFEIFAFIFSLCKLLTYKFVEFL